MNENFNLKINGNCSFFPTQLLLSHSFKYIYVIIVFLECILQPQRYLLREFSIFNEFFFSFIVVLQSVKEILVHVSLPLKAWKEMVIEKWPEIQIEMEFV